MDGLTASRLNLLGDPTRWKPIAGAFLVTNEWLKLDQRTLFVERELGEALKRTDLPEGFCPQDLRWRWNALRNALAEATQTDKRTAGVFLDTLSDIAYKEIKKNGEFVLPGFGKLVKQKRKARTGFNPNTQQKIKIPAKTVVKFRVANAAKDGGFGVKK